MHLARPEALLLGLLVLLVLRRSLLAGGRLVAAIRLLLLACLLGLVSDPWLVTQEAGRDLLLVVDRSRSMPPETLDRAGELHELARKGASPGDRIGIVVFARDATVARVPEEDVPWGIPAPPADADATDLAGAIDQALAILPPGRHGSILLVSDGESTGRDPASAARHALARGVRIDTVPVRRAGVFDLAVEEIAVPGEVMVGEPFPLTLWVRSDRQVEAPIVVRRDGVEIASGVRRLRRGLNAVRLKERLGDAGVHAYEVGIQVEGDRVPENDQARAAVRVSGRSRVLLVTPQGREDRLTRSLRQAGLDIVVAAPETAPLDLSSLDGFRAVVLENVPLEDLPPGADPPVATWVRDLGGGLMMTGGGAAFGAGGYYRSAIETALPVTMEVRQEQRRFHLAMSIALDRSGSMSMVAARGLTKMSLANLGACAAVELLGPGDAVAVIAVDSLAHEVVPLVNVENGPAICDDIRKIESMGGGIFVNVALRAAAAQLQGAIQGTRHIVLFADAADAEEPGDYRKLVPDLVRAGVTVSVIGLGADTDSDARLLREIARLGGGRCFFASDAGDLPRVFAQETIQVARSSLVEERTEVRVDAGILAVGALEAAAFPAVGGYSIAYLEPEAQRGLKTLDDTGAPLLAFWQHGLGRTAAYLGVADGELSGDVATWDGYADFFTTLVRWIAGSDASGDVYSNVERRGHEGVVRVEVERGREALLSGLEAHVLDTAGVSRSVTLARVGEGRLEARFPLAATGVHRPVLRFPDGEVRRLPPVSLPYSPEFEPRPDPAEGEEVLARIARVTEGRVDPPAAALWEGERASRGATPLTPWLALAALGLLLLEIAVRRLRLRVPTGAVGHVVERAWHAIPRRRKQRQRPDPIAEPAGETATLAAPTTEPSDTAETERSDDIASVLERARRRGRHR